MKISFTKSVAVVVIFLLSCSSGRLTKQPEQVKAEYLNCNIVGNGKMYASAFIQTAAEYRALCYQAFNLARLRLDQYLEAAGRPGKYAIVTDIDETLLSNSSYEVKNGLQGKSYSQETWYQWTALGRSDTIPGALTFLTYAKSKGVDVFYVTNRDEVEREGTLKNLKKFGFPNADTSHLFLREKSSGKDSRRVRVSKTHDIVMLIGDNLADFSSMFDKKSVGERSENVDKLRDEFGNIFIVIPNPVYGDWESALFKYEKELTQNQKDSIIKASLKGF